MILVETGHVSVAELRYESCYSLIYKHGPPNQRRNVAVTILRRIMHIETVHYLPLQDADVFYFHHALIVITMVWIFYGEDSPLSMSATSVLFLSQHRDVSCSVSCLDVPPSVSERGF